MKKSMKLKQQEWLERWKLRGGNTRKYKCPSCAEEIERHTPENPGEVWDTAVECYACSGLHFVVVPYRGKIKVEKIQDPSPRKAGAR